VRILPLEIGCARPTLDGRWRWRVWGNSPPKDARIVHPPVVLGSFLRLFGMLKRFPCVANPRRQDSPDAMLAGITNREWTLEELYNAVLPAKR
jgi:hypothetical protein